MFDWRVVFVGLTASLLAAASGWADETAGQPVSCTVAQVEIAPQSVIEPCTRVISNAQASAAARGFALFVRGQAYHNSKKFDLAAQDYDEAIKLTPTNEELFVSRANIAFRAGRPREGLALLQKALNLNPRNAHALRTLGALSEQDGDLPEAVSYYTQALASEPADAYALYFRSQVYATLHKFDDALKDADALVAIPPPEINRQGFLDGEGNRLDFHIIALRVRAGIYSAIGQSVRAEQDLSEAVAYNHSAQAFATRGKFLASKPGREREALADLDAAIGLNLIDPTLSYAKGLVLTRVKNFPDAISAFDQALRIYPQFAIALRMRARAYRELDQTDLAVADMEHAIAISPSMLRETIPALRLAGYWQSKDDPIAITPAFEDALRACMLDKQCN